MQAHINASGDPRRGDDMPLVDDTRIRQHFYRRVALAHHLNGSPVRGGPVLVQQPTLGKQESPGADAGGQPGLLILLANPPQHTGIREFAEYVPPRHHKDIQWWVILYGGLRLDQQPSAAGDDPVFFGNGHDLKELTMLAGFAY